jgi:thymidylate synthase ThyX
MGSQSPEKFTKEERWFLEPFFTNLDRNVFAAKYLPSEVLGALASRYSRSTKGVRRLFYDEYIKPILEPDLEGLDKRTIRQAEAMKNGLFLFVDFLHKHGGWEAVVNSKRARDFFKKWLAGFGDDSIAQMAGGHIFFENISIVATKILEDCRIGLAPLEKSTRYVKFDQKFGGRWLYFVEPDLVRSRYGQEYVKVLNMLFRRYAASFEPLSKYLRKKFPKEADQSERAYDETIKAKACDILRSYLPAATLTNVGFFGVGQAFDYLLTKCFAHPLAEIRLLAKDTEKELRKVIPSLVYKASSPIGKMHQKYLKDTENALGKLSEKFASGISQNSSDFGVDLIEWDAEAEDKIIATLLYKYSKLSFGEIKEKVRKLSIKEKLAIIQKAIAKRKFRQHKLVRAFENTYYKFDIVANLGMYRDLQRHRMLTQERQRFTTELGFDIPQELSLTKLDSSYIDAAKKVDRFYRKVSKNFPDQAQYAVMLGHRIRWYQWENLRELAWEVELRTGPQGHPDYRRIEHLKVKAVEKIHPTLVKTLKFVDWRKYDLARRESEKMIDKNLGLTPK